MPVVQQFNSAVGSLASSSAIDLLRNIIFLHVLSRFGSKAFYLLRVKGIVGATKEFVGQIVQALIKTVRSSVPGANAAIQSEIQKQIKAVEEKTAPDVPGEKKYLALPPAGLSEASVRGELVRYQKMAPTYWKDGKVSGAIYHGGGELSTLLGEAYSIFNLANPLHPELFPGIRKMEAEVVSMVLSMYNAPAGACGNMTSGGTESLLMAVKTYRDMARQLRGVTEPEMIIPVTAHAALDKGSNYFGVKIIHIPIDSTTGKVDLKKMGAAINRNTIMLVGSAPNFPHGIIDDIPEIAKLAKSHKIGMHVDACLGGFLVPFMEKAGFPLPYPVDFRVDGVTSISCDPHKYGFAPKGSSVILFRTKQIRNHMYFVQTEWPGGIYGSPSIAGSRPGALIAGCWTAMIKFGEDGYVKSTQDIVGVARKLVAGIKAIDGLRVIGDPLVSVVSFDSVGAIKIYGVADYLTKKGWHLNVLQFPQAIHIACTLLTLNGADDLLQDLKDAVALLKANPNMAGGEVTAIYGTAASIPDRSIVGDVTRGFLDSLTKA
ncbi:pyridoxal phosphate-dependent transferase [Cladochytrium replicatum]|nr:pyridoxal phosphate-dependent transferase [Cladochytrium replicatum]